MSKDKRFEKIYSQSMGSIEIFVDRETGVNYLYKIIKSLLKRIIKKKAKI